MSEIFLFTELRCRATQCVEMNRGFAKGFSLVELSIVLVILGLLVGGVLTGQSLIRAAELRSVTTELQQYTTAVQTFRDRFFALPGDMRNAEGFWDTMSVGTCPAATGGTGTQTCNGNGDGRIGIASAVSVTGEQYTFWQHLANAGLIEGSFTGIAGASNANNHDAGVNAPRSRLNQGVWASTYINNSAGVNSVSFAYNHTNSWLFGSDDNSWADGPLITPEEAWNIDTKTDDGLPGRGVITATFPTRCGTAVDSNDLDALYNLAVSSVECSLIFSR